MRDYVDLGSAPALEECVQFGTPDYYERIQLECQRYIILIKAALGEPPEGVRLVVKGNPHDFGTYYEVMAAYDTNNEAAAEWAWDAQEKAPAKWLYNGIDYSQGRWPSDDPELLAMYS
jgi:hypothetical protein